MSVSGFYFFTPKKIEVINLAQTTYGTIESFKNSFVSSNLNNITVKSMIFNEGNFVKKGETLLNLDNSDLLIDLKKTDLSIEQTKANIDKIALNLKGLRAKQSINTLDNSDLEESKNKIDMAKINFDNSKAQLNN